jgi:hypothetical protein
MTFRQTQNFLTNYRARLETMSEAESTALALREVYSAYYSEMGGLGAAQARKPETERKVVRLPKSPRPQPAGAARNSSRSMIRKSLCSQLGVARSTESAMSLATWLSDFGITSPACSGGDSGFRRSDLNLRFRSRLT